MKKSNFYISAIALLLLTISACKKDEDTGGPSFKACIETTADSYSLFETVIFTSCSKGAVKYSWNFGEGFGDTANTANASHRYYLPDTFTVKLTIANADGVQDRAEKKIVIRPAEIADYLGTFNMHDFCVFDNFQSVISTAGGNNLTISNFGNLAESVVATLINGEVIIAPQTISGFSVSGTGKMNSSGIISLTYTANGQTCTVAASK